MYVSLFQYQNTGPAPLQNPVQAMPQLLCRVYLPLTATTHLWFAYLSQKLCKPKIAISLGICVSSLSRVRLCDPTDCSL